MLPTPVITHLSSDHYKTVYEPAGDTFLLIDALEKQEQFIKSLRPSVCVEVGTGSGICITFLAQLIGPNCLYVGTDVNPQAVDVSLQTARRNGVRLEVVQTDLMTSLSPRLFGAVDVLIFNPPYVVTPSEEVGGTGIEASWAGGNKGREVTDRLLPNVPQLLSSRGAFYLLIIKENDQDDLERVMKGYGFDMSVVMSRRCGPEFQSILRFVRRKEHSATT